MRLISKEETIKQSQKTFERWQDIWEANAQENKKNYKKQAKTLRGCGYKPLAIFSFGNSFEQNLDDFIALDMHFKYDIICIDKCLKYFIRKGIYPKFVLTADARLPFSECIDNVNDQVLYKKTTLIMGVLSNPSWSKAWSDNNGSFHFYINKDGIRTHKIYNKHFNYDKHLGDIEAELISAATNVANTCVVYGAQIMNYRTIILLGFDYSFPLGGNFYGCKDTTQIDRDFGRDKSVLNNHINFLDNQGVMRATSVNMEFSCRWLMDVINQLNANGFKIMNATGAGMIQTTPFIKLNSKRG